jgi:hypothetical protein
VVRICADASLIRSLQKVLTFFYFGALDEKPRSVFVAYSITIYSFMCQCQFFGSPCLLRLSVGPAQGVTSYGLDPLGIPHQIGDL